ncbi:MAG TPA: hypothetical protein VKE74_22075 [Gemmataceae bacterium]|nr:hypothetical protein [Gemmataceae bacterium]
MPDPPPPAEPPPTRARFALAGWLCALSSILFLDRVAWGRPAPRSRPTSG